MAFEDITLYIKGSGTITLTSDRVLQSFNVAFSADRLSDMSFTISVTENPGNYATFLLPQNVNYIHLRDTVTLIGTCPYLTRVNMNDASSFKVIGAFVMDMFEVQASGTSRLFFDEHIRVTRKAILHAKDEARIEGLHFEAGVKGSVTAEHASHVSYTEEGATKLDIKRDPDAHVSVNGIEV